MSENIFIRPASGDTIIPKHTVRVRNALKDLFGHYPITLSGEHIPQLQSMRAAVGELEEADAYHQIIDAIIALEEIEIILR